MQRRGNVSSNYISKNKNERAQTVIPGGTKKKGELLKSLNDMNAKKKERKKLSPEAREKKESSVKSLNAIKKSKRKSTWGFHIFVPKNGPGRFPGTFPGTFPGRFPGRFPDRILCKI